MTCWKNSDGRFGVSMGCLLDNDMKGLRDRFCVALCNSQQWMRYAFICTEFLNPVIDSGCVY